MLKSPLKWDIKTITARRLPFQNASHHVAEKKEQRRGEHEIQLCHGQHISHQFSLTSQRWTVEAQKEQYEDNEMANNKLNCIQDGKRRMAVGRIKGRAEKTNNDQGSHQEAQLIRLINCRVFLRRTCAQKMFYQRNKQ